MPQSCDMSSRVCHLISSAFVDATAAEVTEGRVMVRGSMTAYSVDGAGTHNNQVPMNSPPKIGRADTVFVKIQNSWMLSEQTLVPIYNF